MDGNVKEIVNTLFLKQSPHLRCMTHCIYCNKQHTVGIEYARSSIGGTHCVLDVSLMDAVGGESAMTGVKGLISNNKTMRKVHLQPQTNRCHPQPGSSACRSYSKRKGLRGLGYHHTGMLEEFTWGNSGVIKSNQAEAIAEPPPHRDKDLLITTRGGI